MRRWGRSVAAALAVAALAGGCASEPPFSHDPPPVGGPLKPFKHPLGMTFVLVPAGEVSGRYPDFPSVEEAQTRMLVPLLFSAHEITNAQFEAFARDFKRIVAARKEKPIQIQAVEAAERRILNHQRSPLAPADDHPVNNVNAFEAAAFCKWLTGKAKSGRRYRLPRNGDWEYAARGGVDNQASPCGDQIDQSKACYDAKGPRPVGSYKPNGYGLYDMAGNVAEWAMTEDAPPFVLRGGAWTDGRNGLRFTPFGRQLKKDEVLNGHGFRVVCEPPLP